MSAFVIVMVDFRDVLTVIKLWLIDAEASKPRFCSHAHLKMNDSGGFKTLKLSSKAHFLSAVSTVRLSPLNLCSGVVNVSGSPWNRSASYKSPFTWTMRLCGFMSACPMPICFLWAPIWPHAAYLGHPLAVISVSCGPLKPARLGVYLTE